MSDPKKDWPTGAEVGAEKARIATPIRSLASLTWSREKPATIAGPRDLYRRCESCGRTGQEVGER